jgi:hypothetical protein
MKSHCVPIYAFGIGPIVRRHRRFVNRHSPFRNSSRARSRFGILTNYFMDTYAIVAKNQQTACWIST